MTEHDLIDGTSVAILPTVSRAFLADWLSALQDHCAQGQLEAYLDEIGLDRDAHPHSRVTHDQIVRLYQLVANGTGDEMTGLWSRPVRKGALKLLCSSVRGASSLSAALYRFSSFWNLVLDDCRISLDMTDAGLRIALEARNQAVQHRFGHVLLLKLAHGIASWLAGRELPLHKVSFVFDRPDFAEDYPILFPAAIQFGQACSSLTFIGALDMSPVARSEVEMQQFLQRAPRDWIFTNSREHAMMLRVRELLLASDRLSLRLEEAAEALHLSARTLIRRLDAENTSFQAIKDGLRRDLSIRDLSLGTKTIEAISQDLGYATAANFHRAFKLWTGLTPGAYRRL